jgi:hypothetical protein
MNGASVIWSQTNFRVVIGAVELGCAEVRGFGSQTVSASATVDVAGAAAAPGAAGGPPAAATGATATPTPTPWANDVGPWIAAGPNGHPPSSPIPALEWTLTPVTIRRALDQSQALFAWRAAVVAGQPDTRDVMIQLLDAPRGQPVLAWMLYDAWPLSWSGPVLDASQPGVALEQVELAYARLRWLNHPETGDA